MRWTLLLALALAGQLRAESPDEVAQTQALARNLRNYLAEHLPSPLIENDRDWGKYKLVTRGIEWKGNRILPRGQKSHKNHGVWRRYKVTTLNPRQTLAFDIRDVRQVRPDTRAFTAVIAFDCRLEAEQQNWRSGVRVWSGSLRARVRVAAVMQCEVTSRLEVAKGSRLPELVFRVRVLSATLGYDNFVAEHVNGIGGEMAEWLGDAGKGLMHRIRPSVERNLLERGGAAIVKAADTKEVRVGFGKLFR
jgi:hypothetical protein